MNNKILPVITFVAGAAIGAAATFFIVKDRYEKIADAEIEEMRDYYLERLSQDEDEDEEEIIENEKEEAEKIIEDGDYVTTTQSRGVMTSATQVIPEEEGEPEVMDDRERPYVISPEEFDELDDYNTISLTYYADQVLADDQMNVIYDVDEIVGEDSLTHFGEYEDDSVFVRNDKLKSDYEILLDNKTYEELMRVE